MMNSRLRDWFRFTAEAWRERLRAARSETRGIVRLFGWLLARPAVGLWHLPRGIGAAGAWIAGEWSRPASRRLLLGLPALLAVLAAVAGVLWLPAFNREHYWDKAAASVEARQFEKARVEYRRLLQDHPDDPDAVRGLAQSLGGLGFGETAAQMLAAIGPDEKDPAIKAAMRKAEVLLTGVVNPQSVTEAEQHLHGVLERRPEHPRAHALMATICANRREYLASKRHLEQTGSMLDAMGVQIAEYCARNNDTTASTSWLQRAAAYYRNQAKTRPDHIGIALNWAQATMLLDDFPGTLAILEEAWGRTREPSLRKAMARVYLAWSLTPSSRRRPEEALRLVRQGLEFDPEDVRLREELRRLRGR